MTRVLSILMLILGLCPIAFAQTQENACPSISIIYPGGILLPKRPTTFKATLSGPVGSGKLTYTWASTAGKVTGEFGAPVTNLTVDKNGGPANITLFVRVDGLDKQCPDSASDIFGVAMPSIEAPQEYGNWTPNNVKATMDNFFIHLNSSPSSEGLITVNLDTRDTKTRKLRSLRTFFDAVRFRNYDVTRLSFLITERSGASNYALRSIVPGGDLPDDAEKTNLIKGEDLIKDLRKGLPKKECKCPPQANKK